MKVVTDAKVVTHVGGKEIVCEALCFTGVGRVFFEF